MDIAAKKCFKKKLLSIKNSQLLVYISSKFGIITYPKQSNIVQLSKIALVQTKGYGTI